MKFVLSPLMLLFGKVQTCLQFCSHSRISLYASEIDDFTCLQLVAGRRRRERCRKMEKGDSKRRGKMRKREEEGGKSRRR